MKTEEYLSERFLASHPEDGAILLQRFSIEELKGFFCEIRPSIAARVLESMPPMMGSDLIIGLGADGAVPILEKLSIPVAAGLFRRISPQDRISLLKFLPKKVSFKIQSVLHYPPGTAGALMDPNVFAVPSHFSIREARFQMKRFSKDLLSYLYIVDSTQKLLGVMSVRELMVARPLDRVSSVMKGPVASLSAHAGEGTVLNHPAWKTYHKIPVTEKGGLLVGVIRYKTLRKLEGIYVGPPM